MIKACSCENKYQDARYGKGMRVHTEGKRTDSGKREERCTICSGPTRTARRLVEHAKMHLPVHSLPPKGKGA